MKRLPILSVLAAASAIAAPAQMNSPASQGYMARGLEMLSAENYTGCIDQLRQVDRSLLSASEVEDVDWALRPHSAPAAHRRLRISDVFLRSIPILCVVARL